MVVCELEKVGWSWGEARYQKPYQEYLSTCLRLTSILL